MLWELINEPFDALRQRNLHPVEVSVLDSGIDAAHADLAGSCVDAVAVELNDDGLAVVPMPPNANNDLFDHGTAVASIVRKVAPNTRIVDVRVLGLSNTGAGDALVAGLKWAIKRRSPIINMSLAASPRFSSKLAALCEVAYRQGQVVVAARRNLPLTDDGFPAELSSAISVDRKTMEFLKIGYRVPDPIEFEAHGDSLVVAAPGGGYAVRTGTSFATPAVAGMCALLLGVDPTLRPFELKTLLKAAADRGRWESLVRERAYTLWQQRGCTGNLPEQDWHAAEFALMAEGKTYR